MKTLLLMRHAKAGPAVGGLQDVDRPLVDAGRAAAERIGKFLKTEKLLVDVAISSSAVRAQETCEIALAAAGLALDVQLEQRIYDGGAVSLLDLISEVADSASVALLVGHNPVLEDLVLMLSGRSVQLAPASLVKITLETERWSDIVGARGSLDRVVKPADLTD